MDKDWIPVVSGAVGAGGAVLAQITAAIFTGRRETKAGKARRAEARASAFADQKRDLFLKTLKVLDQELEDYDAHSAKVEAGTAPGIMPTGVHDESKWAEVAADIDLLAPDIVGKLNACLKQFHQIDFSLSLANTEKFKEQVKASRQLRNELRDEMRVSLNVADAPTTYWSNLWKAIRAN